MVADAISEVCDQSDYEEFYEKDAEFKKSVDQLRLKRDDTVRAMQMDLIISGSEKLTSEYMKELNKATDGDTLGTIQRETMAYIVGSASNNSTAVESFIRIFSCTKYRANQIFSEVLKQYDLESPTARSKNKEENLEKSLHRRFERNELTEVDMYKELVSDALNMSQFASREDVRINAGKLVVVYMDKLEEVQARQRREGESDNHKLTDKVDAVHFGSSIDHVIRVKDVLDSKELKEIENGPS